MLDPMNDYLINKWFEKCLQDQLYFYKAHGNRSSQKTDSVQTLKLFCYYSSNFLND